MHVHFIGICGIGMSAIARILLEMGYKISGSDPSSSPIKRELMALGATIYKEHRKENVLGVDAIVVSSAVHEENPEIVQAKKDKIEILHRSEMLQHIMKEHTGIAVSGTCGKTTVTSLLATLLDGCGLDPTVAVGGVMNNINSNGKLGSSGYMVVEADESDGSFLRLTPRWAIVTNIDVDVNLNIAPYSYHGFDYQRTLNAVEEAFVEFINRLPSDGGAVLCADDANLRSLFPRIRNRYITYGFAADADLRAVNIGLRNFSSSSTVIYRGKTLGRMDLNIPGRHNIQNALSVIGVGLQLGLDFADMVEALGKFQGVGRRFQRIGEVNGVLIVDDYAHNPDKVKALLHAARTGGKKRVIGVFQPHRFTRTKFMMEQFADCFFDADHLIITEIYGAGENHIVGIKGETLKKRVEKSCRRPEKIEFIPTKEEIVNYLEIEATPGDIIVTIGAGDIYLAGEMLLKKLNNRFIEQEAVG